MTILCDADLGEVLKLINKYQINAFARAAGRTHCLEIDFHISEVKAMKLIPLQRQSID
jgi:hypothetical protein